MEYYTDLTAVRPAASGGLHQPPGPLDVTSPSLLSLLHLIGVRTDSLHLLDEAPGGQTQPQQPAGEELRDPAVTTLKNSWRI